MAFETVLPSREQVHGVSDDLVEALMELHLNPAAFAVLSRILDIGLFDALRDGRVDETHLRGDPSPAAVEMGLDLGTALGLFRRDPTGWAPTELTRTFLSPDAPLRMPGLHERYREYLGTVGHISFALEHTTGRHGADHPILHLTTAQRQERAALRHRHWNAASFRYFWDSAILVMRAYRGVELSGRSVACDLGAASGGFAALLKKWYPAMRVLAVESSYRADEYRRATCDALEREGCELELIAADVIDDPIPGAPDLITINRVFSGMPEEGCRFWADKVFATLVPGGIVALADFFTVGDVAHDRYIAQMWALLWGKTAGMVESGRVWHDHFLDWLPPWRADQVTTFLTAAGFVDVRVEKGDPPLTCVHARKP